MSEMIEALAYFECADGSVFHRRFGVPVIVASELGKPEKRMGAVCFVVAQIVHAVTPADIDCAFLVAIFRDVPGFGPKLFQDVQSGKWRDKTIGYLAKLKEPEIEAEFVKKGL